MIVLNGFEN